MKWIAVELSEFNIQSYLQSASKLTSKYSNKKANALLRALAFEHLKAIN
ncbi:hypothetical protein [Methylotenera versatilis]|nr:hypothetical protein [Methylotenera versatilis]